MWYLRRIFTFGNPDKIPCESIVNHKEEISKNKDAFTKLRLEVNPGELLWYLVSADHNETHKPLAKVYITSAKTVAESKLISLDSRDFCDEDNSWTPEGTAILYLGDGKTIIGAENCIAELSSRSRITLES